MLSQELANNHGSVLMQSVHRVVHAAHIVGGDAAASLSNAVPAAVYLASNVRTHDRHGVIGREVMAVVFEHDQAQRRDQPVCVRSGDDIDA